MKLGRDLWVHCLLLAVALCLALVFWLRDESPGAEAKEMVEVWSGSTRQVESVRWEGKKRTVSLSAQRDDVGRFFIGTLEEEVARVKAKPKPSRPPAGSQPDAGAALSTEPDAGATAETETERRRETTRFVSAGAADKLLERLAPLRAYRALGQIDAAREEEFGLKEPTGTLRVNIGGQERVLLVGGRAPGDADYYARRVDSGEVFAVPGEIVRALMSPTSRLLEQDLHGWEPEEVTRVVITAGEGRRELVPVSGKQQAWANPNTPAEQDETAGNFMNKLGRLRVMRYLEKPRAPVPVVQLDYYAGSRKIGFLELIRVPGEKDKPDYAVRTEYTRWYGTVFRSNAEQLQQDLSSVVQ